MAERILPQAGFALDQLTVVVLSEGSKRAGMERDKVQQLLNEHLQYTLGLARSGQILAAGAFIDEAHEGRLTGLGFSRLPTGELAALESQDPAMQSGIEDFRVVEYLFPKGAISFVAELNPLKAKSRRLYEEVFGKGNLDVADEIMAADCVSHGPGAPLETGTDGIKRQAIRLRIAIPDLTASLNFQVAEDDRVTSHWTGSGTHTGEMTMPAGPVRPTGKLVSFDELRIDRYTGGKIVESWFLPDRLTLWSQLGLL